MSPKRMMVISAGVWLVLLAITSYAETQMPEHWWVRTGGVVLRALPLSTFILGVMRWQYLRERWPQRPAEQEIDHEAGGKG